MTEPCHPRVFRKKCSIFGNYVDSFVQKARILRQIFHGNMLSSAKLHFLTKLFLILKFLIQFQYSPGNDWPLGTLRTLSS